MFDESLPKFEEKIQKLIDGYKELQERCTVLESEKNVLEQKNMELAESSDGKLMEFEDNFAKQTEQLSFMKEENSKLAGKVQEYETKMRTVSDKIDSIFEQLDEI
jgi:chromosome segregation ATPase